MAEHKKIKNIPDVSKLTLGAAQIGFKYGIANMGQELKKNEALKILHAAYDNGVNSFDTSYSYGKSESFIGEFILSAGVKPFVATKLPKIDLNPDSDFQTVFNVVKGYVNTSLKRLNLQKVSLYYLHDASDMLSFGGKVIRSLSRLKDEGFINSIGVSVYYPEEARQAMQIEDIEAVQLPVNIFDHRFISTGVLKELADSGKTIFARSIFLQGLFFLSEKDIPGSMSAASKYLKELRGFAAEQGVGVDELSVRFVKSFPEISSLVIGAEREEQVIRNIRLANASGLSRDLIGRFLDLFSKVPENIIIPSLWSSQ